MNVRITGSIMTCWYSNKTGEVFVVQKEVPGLESDPNPVHRLIAKKPEEQGRGIYFNDFEIVNDKEEFPTLVGSYDFTSI